MECSYGTNGKLTVNYIMRASEELSLYDHYDATDLYCLVFMSIIGGVESGEDNNKDELIRMLVKVA